MKYYGSENTNKNGTFQAESRKYEKLHSKPRENYINS